ncbi:MAG: hypothetical protein WC565_04940 [Parcubacteria group bacterium]
MDSVKFSAYSIIGCAVAIDTGATVELLNYAHLQERLDRATRERDCMRFVYCDAMAYMREHLTLEQANAKYAVDTNTAWAQMGVKGGAM